MNPRSEVRNREAKKHGAEGSREALIAAGFLRSKKRFLGNTTFEATGSYRPGFRVTLTFEAHRSGRNASKENRLSKVYPLAHKIIGSASKTKKPLD